MTIKFNELSQKIQERIRRDNPDVFRPMVAEVAEPTRKRGSEDQKLERSKKGVRYCITLIALRRRLLDQHDNARAAAKPLVDKITSWLGFRADNDPRLKWEYSQCQTTGEQGVIVKIEQL